MDIVLFEWIENLVLLKKIQMAILLGFFKITI